MSSLRNRRKPFSTRHQKVLNEGLLSVELTEELRNRLLTTVYEFDDEILVYPFKNNSSYHEQSTVLGELIPDFIQVQGWRGLIVRQDESEKIVENLGNWFRQAWAPHLLDFIEVFAHRGDTSFSTEINEVFEYSRSAWRICDGVFLKLDLEFLEFELASRTQDLLVRHGFEGAFEEFRSAREDCLDGENKDAIHKSCKSMESTLKKILGISTGTAEQLIDKLGQADFFNDLPPDKHAIVRNALKQLAILRNEIGAHGQGAESIEIPSYYAQLCLNLSATYNYFLITKYIARMPSSLEENKTDSDSIDENDLPF